MDKELEDIKRRKLEKLKEIPKRLFQKEWGLRDIFMKRGIGIPY